MTSTLGSVRRRRTEEAAASAGVEHLPVESLSPPARRRPSWLAAGALLIALAALLGAWVYSSATSTISVMVAARDLPPGHVVTPADLRVVEMGRAGGLRAVQVDQQELLLGTAARALIPEGTVVHTGLFTRPESVVPPGKVVVGGSFTAGATPVADLRPGQRVVLLEVSSSTLGLGDPDAAALELGTAEVWAVQGSASSGAASERVWISLLVDTSIQTDVADAAANDRLRLGLVGG